MQDHSRTSNLHVAVAASSVDQRRAGGPLRIVMASAGKMAQHHARAIQRLAGVAEVVAVCDPMPDAAEAIRAIWPDAVSGTSLEDLLEEVGADVVHVCTPPDSHEEIAGVALEAGCHVYVEKPFTPTADGAARLIGMAEDRGLKVCAGHQLLFEAPARSIVEFLPAIGSVAHVESYFSFRTVRHSPNGRTPLRADLQLLDILPHPVYLLLYFLEAAVPGGRTEMRNIEVGPAGTVHAFLRRGELTGTLVVTLEGRPVESYLRAVGANGSIHADFVRGTVQRLIGPGSSGIDKLLSPYSVARQLVTDTTAAMGRRFLKRQRSYPGLAELLEAFYQAIRSDEPAPISTETLLETVRVCEDVQRALPTRQSGAPKRIDRRPTAGKVMVTGGTGFLGAELVRTLAASDADVRAIARREPAAWESVPDAEYAITDLSQSIDPGLLRGVETIVHCAAATAGGWEEHRSHSIGATENLIRAAAEAGIKRFIHISSVAVIDEAGGRGALGENSPLEPRPTSRGPYVWGKLESEKLAVRLGAELGIAVKVVRPGPIVDYRRFEPPGRLGKRMGNLFVAVGSPRETLGVVDVEEAGRVLAWATRQFEEMPDVLNLLSPRLPTRGDLVRELRRSNPDLRVVWLPRIILNPASIAGVGLQKIVRRGKPAINVSRAFASRAYDTARATAVFDRARR